MIWVNIAYLVGFIYGLFVGTVLSVRIGKRDTLVLGLLVFCVGNVLCGAATGLFSLAAGRSLGGGGVPNMSRLLGVFPYYGPPYTAAEQADPLPMPRRGVRM